MKTDEKTMYLIPPGMYCGGDSIPPGDFELIYPEDAESLIDVEIEKGDGTYASIIMSREIQRVHLHVRKHYCFIISHQVGIVVCRQPSIFL